MRKTKRKKEIREMEEEGPRWNEVISSCQTQNSPARRDTNCI